VYVNRVAIASPSPVRRSYGAYDPRVLPIVRAEGDAGERGRTIGRELGDLIERSLAFYREWLARRDVGPRELARLLEPYRTAAAALPEQVALLEGIAAGAGVSPDELWAVNALEELEPALAAPALERCSTFTAVAPGATILAHNEQWSAGDAGNVAVVVEAPADGVRLASPTLACCLPAVGMNSAGLAQGIDSLSAPDDRAGVPRVLVSRHALAASAAEEAVARAAFPRRAGGYAHVLALRGGDALTVETTSTRSAVLTGPGAHTNHYLDPVLAAHGDPPSEGSLARQARLETLIRERPPATPEQAMEILRDHASSPQAVCEHGEPGDDEASVVLFSMVCELEQGRMWVAPGNPCETPYEEVDLAGLAAAS
jgi:isopenicillin-N N-acyltransferase like protein